MALLDTDIKVTRQQVLIFLHVNVSMRALKSQSGCMEVKITICVQERVKIIIWILERIKITI